jgi:hypothetical protein
LTLETVLLPGILVLLLFLAGVGSTAVASLALAHVLSGWVVFFFYVLPATFFGLWTVREFAPGTWRRASLPLRLIFRRSRLAPPPAAPRSPPPPRPAPVQVGDRADRSPPGPLGQVVGPLRRLLRGTVRPWMLMMRVFMAAWRTPRMRRALEIGFGLAAVGIAVVAVLEFRSVGWPLDGARVSLTAAAGALFLSAYAFKALGWQRLFRPAERPRSLPLAAATGAAAVTGLALPGRFDDAIRVGIVRKLPGRRPAVGTIVLSLFLLGMIDAAAMTPLAATAAAETNAGPGVRVAFAVVAGAGLGAAVVLAALPRISSSERLGRFRLTHWLNRHAPGSPADAAYALLFVGASWLARAGGVALLLAALGFGVSLPLALAYLCAGAATGALPISPAGQATQAGVGAAVLAAGGIGSSEAVAFAIAAQLLTVAAGAVVVLFAAALHAVRGLKLARG